MPQSMVELRVFLQQIQRVSIYSFLKWDSYSQNQGAQEYGANTQKNVSLAKLNAQMPVARVDATALDIQQTKTEGVPRIQSWSSRSLFETFGQFDRLT